MNTNVKELTIYTIKDEFKSKYRKVQSAVKLYPQGIPGYQSTLNTDNQLMDWVDWINLENSLNTQKDIKTHPQDRVIKKHLENTTFTGHFKNHLESMKQLHKVLHLAPILFVFDICSQLNYI